MRPTELGKVDDIRFLLHPGFYLVFLDLSLQRKPLTCLADTQIALRETHVEENFGLSLAASTTLPAT